MAEDSKWAANANEAIQISLRHAQSKEQQTSHFQPAFTYPIYGDEETIYGYTGLQIKLDFAADTLRPALDISWEEQMPPTGDEVADDVAKPIKALLPTLEASEQQEGKPFAPPGELLRQYDLKGETYGIWTTTLADPAARQLLRNMQIFVIFFIEGGSCIDLEDPEWTLARWSVFFIYQIDSHHSNSSQQTYTFVGYSTAYRLFYLEQGPSPLASGAINDANGFQIPQFPDLYKRLPSRERISQFLILPPHQHAGHGSVLYSTMMNLFLDDDIVTETSVEDPNESFDDLRDQNDLSRLRSEAEFASLTISPTAALPPSKSEPVDTDSFISNPSYVTRLRTTSKIAHRQFGRLLEMQLLGAIPSRNRSTTRITRKDKATDPQDKAYFFWRLLVKKRLYLHNVDQLAQLDLEERVDKLEETLAGVERDYVRLLELAERREKSAASRSAVGRGASDATNGAKESKGKAPSAAMPSRGVKRRVLDDEEDDLEDDDDAASTATTGSKRQKVVA